MSAGGGVTESVKRKIVFQNIADKLLGSPRLREYETTDVKSRLLAVILLIMILGFGIYDVRGYLTQENYQAPWYGYLFLLTAFVINRFWSNRVAALLTMLMFPSVLFFGLVTLPQTITLYSLHYLLVSIILGSILLRWRELLLYMILILAGIGLLPSLFPAVIPDVNAIVELLVFNAMGGLLVLLKMHLRDRGEQRRQEQITESEKRFHTIFDSVNDAIVVHHPQSGAILEVNQKMCEMYGLTHEEALKSSVGDISSGESPYTQDDAIQSLQRAMKGEPQVFEWHAKGKSGRLFWVEVNMQKAVIDHEDRILVTVRDTSDRKQIQEQLRILSQAVEQSQVSVVITDQRGDVEYVNSKFCQITGYSREEVKGQNPRVLKSGHTPDMEYKRLWETLSAGNVWRGEFHNKKKNGELFWESASISPVKDYAGRITHYLAVKEDITEKKKIEEALAQERYFVEALMNNLPDLIYFKDHESRFVAVSRSFMRLLGLSNPSHIIGRTDFDIFAQEHARPAFEDEQQIMATGIPIISKEEKEVWTDGKVTWALTTKMPWRSPDGKIIGTFGISRDITLRKKYEEANQESEERLKITFEQAAVGIAHVETTGKFMRVNQRFCDILGYTKDELLNLSFQAITHPEHLAVDIHDARELFEGKIENYTKEKRYLRKDGTPVWTNLTVALVRDTQGKPKYSISVIEDISARKQVEEQIRKLNEELEERVEERTAELQAANKELESFSYSVSHDLRAPLRHISGYVELLKERIISSLDEQSLRYLATVEQAAIRLGTLIDQLLMFSRVGRAEIRKMSVDIGEMVNEIRLELAEEHKDRTVSWTINPVPAVEADPMLIRQVLTNLLSNALKFTQKSDYARIEFGCSEGDIDSNEIIFFVKDNGAGFDMKYVGKLFGVFQRLHAPDEFEGTGIGLANVRRIIQKHGGRTWAEGVVDGGAIFYFTLSKS
ncbi:MAG: PAS domain S-box protein [bacterium]